TAPPVRRVDAQPFQPPFALAQLRQLAEGDKLLAVEDEAELAARVGHPVVEHLRNVILAVPDLGGNGGDGVPVLRPRRADGQTHGRLSPSSSVSGAGACRARADSSSTMSGKGGRSLSLR